MIFNASLRTTAFSQFSRYLFLLLLKRLVCLTSAGVLLIWTIQSLHFVGLVASHGMSLKIFFQLTSLLLPSFLNIILPLSVFAVVLFTYERLSNDRELTILQGCGLSPVQLALPAFFCAFLALLLGYALTLFAVPETYRVFHKQEFKIKNELAGLFLEEGVFNHLPNGMTIYIQGKEENDFSGALIEHQSKSGDRSIIMAESGTLLHGEHGLQILLQNGSTQTVNKENKTLSYLGFQEKIIPVTPAVTLKYNLDPQGMPLSSLFHFPKILRPSLKGKFYTEGFERLSSPLYAPVFTFVALFWLFSGPPRGDRNPIIPISGAIFCMSALLGGNLLLKSFANSHPNWSFLLLCLPAFPMLMAFSIFLKHHFFPKHPPLATKL